MIACILDSANEYFADKSAFQLTWRFVLTIFVIYVLRYLYKLIFSPMDYTWEDSDMKGLSPFDKHKLDLKRKKKLGTLPPFPNGWYSIITSKELKAGEVKHISALGKEWAVFRTKTGKAGVVGAYCPHLGADLSMGTVEGEDLVCPFHAFHFNTEGQCTKIPYQENIPNSMKCQDIPRVVEKNGSVLIWFDVDGKDPDWEVPEIPEISDKNVRWRGTTRHTVHTHLQEIHENGADQAHLPVVHWRTIFFYRPLWHQWGIKWAPNETHKWKTDFEVKEVMKVGNWTVPFTTFNVEGHHIGPGFVHFKMQSVFGPIWVVHNLLPVEGFLQKSNYEMWAPKHIPVWFCKIVLLGWANQYERDIKIWNQKMFLNAPQIVKNDGPIVQYRRWFKQFYSEKGTKTKVDFTNPDFF
mmetsp:Transcript_36634/g.42799  ORF Transcript_36634/g.42799 Transcript_36634/m.42799 type:complete len:409 (+) Transcript_36634:24-1250(+)